MLFAIISSVLLAGCGLSPVKSSFPDVPTKLMEKPVEMKTLVPDSELAMYKITDDTASKVSLTVVIKTITDNYKTCNLYKEQVFSLQDWISQQKKLNP